MTSQEQLDPQREARMTSSRKPTAVDARRGGPRMTRKQDHTPRVLGAAPSASETREKRRETGTFLG